MADPFDPAGLAPASLRVWDGKYRFKAPDGAPIDATIEGTWRRVAGAVASAEPDGAPRIAWGSRFYSAMEGFRFLPAGRIVSGAGTGRRVTLSNCFVMGTIEDDLGRIFDHLKEAAVTMQQGGGIGMDFSTLRPKGDRLVRTGAEASGPLPFMDAWDAMCKTIMSAGTRRGAMMFVLRCDHPDIEAFVEAKRDGRRFRNANLSVAVTDDFMKEVAAGGAWALRFGGEVRRYVKARDLWDRILRATYDVADPGVFFVDRANALHPLNYTDIISTTNPCGEKPMPPYASCILGSLNLAAFVRDPYGDRANLDTDALRAAARVAVRFLDDVIDVTGFPLERQEQRAKAAREIGLGITGLADALVMTGHRYGTEAAAGEAGVWMRYVAAEAYGESVRLAAEKGAFPLLRNREHFDGPAGRFLRLLPADLQEMYWDTGIRNGVVLSVAPTGTISFVADNVSSGIEPIFAGSYARKVLEPDGTRREERVVDHALRVWEARFPILAKGGSLPRAWVTVADLRPEEHVRMQAAVGEWVDSAVSKTVNVPEDIAFEDFRSVYDLAYRSGCKGCTTFRPNPTTGSVLSADPPAAPSPETVGPIAVGDRVIVVESTPLRGTAGEVPIGSIGTVSRTAVTDRDLVAVMFPPFGEFWVEPRTLRHRKPTAEETGVRAISESVVGAKIDAAAMEAAVDGAVKDHVAEVDKPPPPRPESLRGTTYKVRHPESEHAFYVTVNDIGDGAERRPYEVFVASRDLGSHAWVVALTRMVSAIFRRGGDVGFVAEELRGVFDPRGGHWEKGKYVPSLVAAIGEVIARHLEGIAGRSRKPTVEELEAILREPDRPVRVEPDGSVTVTDPGALRALRGLACPKCGRPTVTKRENCLTCLECDWSKCE